MLAALRSSARPKLVSIAIAEKAAADDAHRKLVSADESLEHAVYAADAAVEAARKAVEDAREATVAHLTATATGAAGKAPKTVKQARQELADAEEALDLARAARDGLRGRIDEARVIATRMVDRVRVAARAVLAESPVAKGLLAETIAAQRELIARGRALSWLMSQDILPGDSGGPCQVGDPHREAWMTKQFVDGLPIDFSVSADAENGAAAWRTVLEALMQDPNAPLPGGDR
jgi:hypothetical protein